MPMESKSQPISEGYFAEDPKDVVFDAMQRKPVGAK